MSTIEALIRVYLSFQAPYAGDASKVDLWGCSDYSVEMTNGEKLAAENELESAGWCTGWCTESISEYLKDHKSDPSEEMLDVFEKTWQLQRNELEGDGLTFKNVGVQMAKYGYLGNVCIKITPSLKRF